VGGHFESAAGAGGGLLENEGDVLAGEAPLLGAGVLGFFEVRGQLEQESQFLLGEVEFFEEVPVSKIESHFNSP
jgi:hypothetical protein